MMDPVDLNAALVINCGMTDLDVYVDNVSLVEIPNGVSDHEAQPETWSLNQNYPNPFNLSTQITFTLGKDEQVTLSIYNVRGQHVSTLLDEFKSAGSHTVDLDGTHLSAGLYFYKLQTSSFTDIRKMILLK